MAPAYDPHTALFMVVTHAGYGNVYYKNPRLQWADGAYWGGQAVHLQDAGTATEVRALAADTGALRWAYRFPGNTSHQAGGLLATAGGVVFAGAKERMVALDSGDGRELWYFDTGGVIDAASITYLAGERQQITLAAGRTVFTFAVDP
jgi:outer membrane protein assembly factor BamB